MFMETLCNQNLLGYWLGFFCTWLTSCSTLWKPQKATHVFNNAKERQLRQEWNAEGTFLSNCNHTGFICSLLQIISETTSLILRPNGFWPTIDSYWAILSLSHLPHSCPGFFLTCSLGSSGQCSFLKKEGPLVRYSVAHTEVHILGCPSRQVVAFLMGSFILLLPAETTLPSSPEADQSSCLPRPPTFIIIIIAEHSVLISVIWYSLQLKCTSGATDPHL